MFCSAGRTLAEGPHGPASCPGPRPQLLLRPPWPWSSEATGSRACRVRPHPGPLCWLCPCGSSGSQSFPLLLTRSSITSSETLPRTTLRPSRPLQLGLDPAPPLPPLLPLSASILFTGLRAPGGWCPLEQKLGGHGQACLCSCNPNSHDSSRRSVYRDGVSERICFSLGEL